MSDLRVWVDGVERVVRGVNEDTTCESVLLALANATGKLGKFALMEKWRDSERILPRDTKPVQCLRMWGKLAKEVQFVLKLMKDNSGHDEGKVGRAENAYKGEDFRSSDHFKGSFEYSSLERTVGNQLRKLKRLSRDLEIAQSHYDCFVEDDENYLYYTEEELAEDRIIKLGHVSKLQSKELAVEQMYLKELARERTLREKLQFEIQSHRNKLRLLDVHISDLENVSGKIYLMVASQDSETDNSSRSDVYDGEELQQEIEVTKEELTKQRELAERQSEELENAKRSLTELENLASQKPVYLGGSKSDLLSGLNLSYYDLDKNLPLDNEKDTSLNYTDDESLGGYNGNLMSSATSLPGHKTMATLSTPSGVRQPSARQIFLARALDDLGDQGVFV